MNKFKRKLQSQRGVSFLEVIIALVLMGVVTAGIFRLYITQHEHYIIQDDVTDVQQNARASIDELSRNIRMAGYDLPVGVAALETYNTDPDTIVVLYHHSGCDTYLSNPMPQPSAELKCGSDISCFYDGQWVFIYDAGLGEGEWFEITEVQSAAFHLQHNTMPLSRSYDADALVLAMERLKYFIDNTTDPDHPKLMVQAQGHVPQVFAENISDLQFSYRMKNGQVFDEPTIVENIREVMIDVTGRSNVPQYGENGEETHRLRNFTTSVFMRNVGI